MYATRSDRVVMLRVTRRPRHSRNQPSRRVNDQSLGQRATGDLPFCVRQCTAGSQHAYLVALADSCVAEFSRHDTKRLRKRPGRFLSPYKPVVFVKSDIAGASEPAGWERHSRHGPIALGSARHAAGNAKLRLLAVGLLATWINPATVNLDVVNIASPKLRLRWSTALVGTVRERDIGGLPRWKAEEVA
jgi:hypothetical protein